MTREQFAKVLASARYHDSPYVFVTMQDGKRLDVTGLTLTEAIAEIHAAAFLLDDIVCTEWKLPVTTPLSARH